MKRNLFLIVIALITFTWACDKDDYTALENTAEFTLKSSEFVVFPNVVCGETTECTLWAGQNKDAGVFTIANTGENLYLKYETTGDWLIAEVHFWVGKNLNAVPKNKPGNIVVGQFPYKYKFNPYVEEASYSISLESLGLEVGDEIFVVAHAVVVKLNADGKIIADETAFGGCVRGNSGNRWFYYSSHIIQDCGPNDYPPVCTWNEETAWAGNTEGNGSGWWFYFDATGPATQNIYAGQKLVEGAYVTLADGYITITLGENLRLQDGTETVKIQGYNNLPDARPAGGQFAYKGTDLVVAVGDFRYFAIHLDVDVRTCTQP